MVRFEDTAAELDKAQAQVAELHEQLVTAQREAAAATQRADALSAEAVTLRKKLQDAKTQADTAVEASSVAQRRATTAEAAHSRLQEATAAERERWVAVVRCSPSTVLTSMPPMWSRHSRHANERQQLAQDLDAARQEVAAVAAGHSASEGDLRRRLADTQARCEQLTREVDGATARVSRAERDMETLRAVIAPARAMLRKGDGPGADDADAGDESAATMADVVRRLAQALSSARASADARERQVASAMEQVQRLQQRVRAARRAGCVACLTLGMLAGACGTPTVRQVGGRRHAG